MKWFYDMKIGTKLITGFVLVAFIAGVIGFVGFVGLKEVGDVRLPSVYHLLEIEKIVAEIDANETALLVPVATYEEKQEIYQTISELEKYLDEHSKEFEKLPMTAEEQKIWTEVERDFQAWKQGHQDFMKFSRELDALGIDNPQAVRSQIAMRQRDHSQWIWLLRESIETGQPFTGELDPEACALGEWLDNYETRSPQLRALMTEIEGHHNRVHESGQSIVGLLANNEQAQARNIYAATSVPNLNSVLELFTRMDGLVATSYNLYAQLMDQSIQINNVNHDKLMHNLEDIVELNVEIAHREVEKSDLMIMIFTIVGVILAIFLGIFISNNIKKPIQKTAEMVEELKMGHLSMRLKLDTKDEMGIMARAMDDFADTLQNHVVGSMQKISKGDVNIHISAKDNKDEITPAIIKTVDSIKAILQDTNMLIEATKEGKLDSRGNTSKYEGSWKELLQGVNELVDAFVAPINVTAEYVERIGNGDIPPKITDSYKGDFNEIKNNLNNCIDAINAMVFDSNELAKAAIEGKLQQRADAQKHGGDFRKIIEGVNQTLDAVIEPVIEASDVLAEMAKGNLTVSVNGQYKGDHAKIKNALNDTIKNVSSYISEISSVLGKMADGDMVVEITRDYLGNFVEIKNALNNIIESFNQVLSNISNAADQVASGSRQMSDSSQALSQGSTEQASSVEELSASITQVAAQTKENASNAEEANRISTAAKDNAARGNRQMQEMLGAMREINESSANISKIIKVIDEIAFQTNILALNAAVEAARAGQHGKGFAVVAEEVRNLAARSANAAKETTALIEGSVNKVEVGTKMAQETAEALNHIVEDVEKTTVIVGNIANASNEQATGITQINRGIEQVSQVIQTNSATAEEGAAASEELSSQAQLLKDMVSRFKLKNTGNGFNLNHFKEPAKNKKSYDAKRIMDEFTPHIELLESGFDKY
jgi:methyl-accepting chemotaxis protein